MAKKQHYMTEAERYKLEAFLRAGKGVSWIARELGFCRQTIYNELRRGAYVHTCEWWDEVRYSADKGQQVHKYNQTAKGRPIKLGKDYSYARFLEEKMLGVQKNGKIERKKRCSPAVALELARREGFQTTVCVSTLYGYIGAGVFLHISNKDLWEKSKRKKRGYEPVRRTAHPKLPSIEERPDHINSREEPGHTEADLVVSRAGKKGGLLTVTERSGRFELMEKIPDRKAATVRAAFLRMKRRLPVGMEIKSITTDNGPEFLEYEELRAVAACPVFYCHSYAAYEKGTNENHNRMIRRWFPKGTDFGRVSRREVQECEDWMNDYPRRSLGWLTPREFIKRCNTIRDAGSAGN